MTQEEYSALKEGDKVWLFAINFNIGSLHGTLGMGLIAELEKRDKEDEFDVIQVKKGTSTKAGRIMRIGKWSDPSRHELFKDYNEGVDYWNSVVHNEVDRLTSKYEQAIKRVKGKLLKKKK